MIARYKKFKIFVFLNYLAIIMDFNQRRNYRVHCSIHKSYAAWRNKQLYHPSLPTNRRKVTSYSSVKKFQQKQRHSLFVATPKNIYTFHCIVSLVGPFRLPHLNFLLLAISCTDVQRKIKLNLQKFLCLQYEYKT